MSAQGGGGPGSIGFKVETQSLIDVAGKFKKLASDLIQLDHCFTVDAQAMGGRDVSDSIEVFLDRSKQGRHGLAEQLLNCATHLQTAGQAYSLVDMSIRNGLGGSGNQ